MGELKPACWQGEYCLQQPLAPHTSWRVGGCADAFFSPASLDELVRFLQGNPGVPLFWLGLGSNLLVRDGGIRGTVISLRQGLSVLREEQGLIYVEAGVPCAKVAKFCQRLGGDNLAFLGGIPGTMGGALAMNAGAFGAETWDFVERVVTINRMGVIACRDPSSFVIHYRQVDGLNQEAFIGAWLRVAAQGGSAINDLLKDRNQKQPIGLPSGGSVFRNPPGDYAGRLIEAAGLKGYQQGGAQVSPKHANFIINLGQASAWDIEGLILHIQAVVKAHAHIVLQPEVHIVGDYLPGQGQGASKA